MSRPPLFPKATVSGIVNDPSSLERVIPESRRADGSIRKERKVRPGFTPAEDVTKFRSQRQMEADRRKLPPGSVVGYIRTPESVQAAKEGMTKSQKKNAKRKEGRTNASNGSAADGGGEGKEVVPDSWDDDDDDGETDGIKGSGPTQGKASKEQEEKVTRGIQGETKVVASEAETDQGSQPSTNTPSSSSSNQQQDPEKRAKALSKKLRAAESLRERESKGEKLLPEQKVKVDSIESIRIELQALEGLGDGGGAKEP
ncbi:hypothetical protein IE53DRAFT_388563 [Violaceomyces palustris]|uniref:Uncharacterized protein n=1 Tax=Violaceomyces palustris TaxID=1673888 RepID=A0ACD0NTR4_9BASI|nr:hypothetical protein IE53DRAFT_388563 [Violaceomyces palustris]